MGAVAMTPPLVELSTNKNSGQDKDLSGFASETLNAILEARNSSQKTVWTDSDGFEKFPTDISPTKLAHFSQSSTTISSGCEYSDDCFDVTSTRAPSPSTSSGASLSQIKPTDPTVITNTGISRSSDTGSLHKSETSLKASDYKRLFYQAMSQINDGKAKNDQNSIKEGIRCLFSLHVRSVLPATYQLGLQAMDSTINDNPYKFFSCAARKGHAASNYMLACAYSETNNKYLHYDINKAWLYHLRAASRKHIGSALWLGRMLLQKDPKMAVKWLQVAAASPDSSFPDAPYELARLYETGYKDVVEKDLDKAFKLYSQSSELAYGPACFRLAKAFVKGQLNCKPDLARAFYLFEQGANLGNVECMIHLSRLYLIQAPGIDPSTHKAFYYAYMAAEYDLPEALHNLGILYMEGIGTPRDEESAKLLLNRAIEVYNYQPSIDYLSPKECKKQDTANEESVFADKEPLSQNSLIKFRKVISDNCFLLMKMPMKYLKILKK